MNTSGHFWHRWPVDEFSGPVMKKIRREYGRDVLLVWNELVTLAKRCNQNGFLGLTEGEPYTKEALAVELDYPIEIMAKAIDVFLHYKKLEADKTRCGFRIVEVERYGISEAEAANRIYERDKKRAQRKSKKEGASNPDRWTFVLDYLGDSLPNLTSDILNLIEKNVPTVKVADYLDEIVARVSGQKEEIGDTTSWLERFMRNKAE